MTDRFKKVVDIILNAYNDDNVKHGFCQKCFVGNLISGFGFEGRQEHDFAPWYYFKEGLMHRELKKGEEMLRLIPYPLDVVFKSEEAFENSRRYNYDIKKDQLSGLTAALNVLLDYERSLGEEETNLDEVFVSKCVMSA